MKALFNSRRHQYLARISILLIMVTLIAGIGGCLPAAEYTLSISDTLGGTVAYPGIGTFVYPEGGVVLLMAEPDAGYSFTHWSGHVSTVANVNAATTTISMYGHYFITANFVYGQLIRTWYDLDAIRNNLTGTYTLMNDLSSTTPGYEQLASPTANGAKGWQPIGNWSVTFNGTFDGQGHKIRDLFIDRPAQSNLGLFGSVSVGGVVRNVGVVNIDVTGLNDVGGLVGYNNGGSVSNSYSSGNVTGESDVGGLVGDNYGGQVLDSYSSASVAGGMHVGGLVGNSTGTVDMCHATGSVGGNYSVGGLVGDNWGNVTDSYSAGSVIGDEAVGGLVGHGGGTVDGSHSTGSVTGNDDVGGLVGCNNWTITTSYSTSSVGGNYSVGGLVGDNWGNVTDSYSSGNVTGISYVGGLMGDNWGTVTSSFWDTETSGQNASAGGTGKNTTEMKAITTFSGALWNIVAVTNPSLRNLSYIWNIVNNVTYPFLSWQPVS
ncbi:MAG: hypothetical protein OEU97_01605 [Dehalococcoidia bacterium]|nr:hypothetical protein [Dehalococcoidia bacterium]MDH4367044.1 hypothetical protein [Dehalococcoidia bacterium]